MDLKQRGADIQQELRRLPAGEPVYIVSLKRRDRYQTEGRIFIAKPEHAAKWVVEGTHEYATKEQIAEYERQQSEGSRAIREQAVKADQKFQINLSPELIAAALAPGKGEVSRGK